MKQKQTEYVTRLQESYEGKKRTGLDELKSLDKKAKMPARIVSGIVGTVGCLIMGFGMAITLKALSLPAALGIVLGCIGIVACSVNYFIYKALLKSGKKKHATEILALSRELLNENN